MNISLESALRALAVSTVAALLCGGCYDVPKRGAPDGDDHLSVDVPNLDVLDDVGLDATQDGFDTSVPDVIEGRTTTVTFDSGEVTVSLDDFRWRVTPSELEVRSRPRDPVIEQSLAIEYGVRGGGFHDPRPRLDQPEQRWRVVEHEQAERGAALTLWLEDARAPERGRVRVRVAADGEHGGVRFGIDPEPADGLEVERIEFVWSDDGGPLYGDGLRLDAANGRGRLRELFAELDALRPSGESGTPVPVAYVLNPRGYGLYADTLRPGVFDLGVDKPFVLRARFDAPQLELQLWVGSRPLELWQRFASRVGRAAVPPRWALAPLQATTLSRLVEDAQALRARGLPVGGLWLSDASWQTATTTLEPDAGQLEDFAGALGGLRAQGFDVVVSSTPYFEASSGSAYDTLVSMGHALQTDGQVPYVHRRASGEALVLDPTSQGASGWWGALAAEVLSAGVRGFVVERELDLLPAGAERVRFADGADGATRQASLGSLLAARLSEALEAAQVVDGFVVTNRAGQGGQGVVQAVRVDGLVAGFGADGMRAALTAAVSLSVSGYGASLVPVGGEVGAVASADLLLRWVAMSVALPVFELGAARQLWSEPERFDGAAQSDLATLLRQRMRLTPYVERVLAQASSTGGPVLRPLGLMFPNDTRAWEVEDAFMLGDDLLVAPVFEAGAATRTLYLPEGAWRHWHTGQVFSGGREVTVSAPRDGMPMFAREGALLPLRLEHVETLGPATEASVVTAESVDATMHVRAIGQARGSVVFDDGGTLTLEFDAPAASTRVRLEAGAVTRVVYLEVLGETPQRVLCGEDVVVPINESIAVVPIGDPEPLEPAYRPLTTGALLRLSGAEQCTIGW